MKKLIIVVILLMLMLAHLMINTNKEEKVYEILSNIELPLGSSVPTIEDFCKEQVDGEIQIYFRNQLVNTINKIGNYQIKINIGNKDYFATLNVIDNEPPSVVLKEVTILQNTAYTVHDFIESCMDNSEDDCLLEFQEQSMEFYSEPGIYEIKICAKDYSNNETLVTTKLVIIEPNVPTIEEMNVSDFSNGVDNYQAKKIIESRSYESTTVEVNKNSLYVGAQSELEKQLEKINGVLEYVNEYRKEVGLKPLMLSNKLSVAATIRSLEMATSEVFSHTRPNGTECFSIFSELEIGARFMGENIAYGYSIPSVVSEEWKKSPSHYANIINPNYIYVGIGVANINGEYYWTQLFSDVE